MWRICDYCLGIFKISKLLSKRLKDNNDNTKVYCPYCNSPFHHQYIKQIRGEIIKAKRGDKYF